MKRGVAAASAVLFAGLCAAPAARAQSHAVTIASFSYTPAEVRIGAGDTVEWRNVDPTVHTVTASRGEFSSGSMRQGQTFRATFSVPGVYPYFCEPHETMRGIVSVSGTTTTTSSAPSVTTTTVAASRSSSPAPVVSATGPSTAVPPRSDAPVTTTASAAAVVVAQAVSGEATQSSPVLPIAGVVLVLFAALARMWRAGVARPDALRFAAAAATAATGILHAQLRWALDYPEPIGTLLVIEAAGATVLAAWLLARPWTRAVQLCAIGAHGVALVALAITRTGVGLFGFHEIGWDPSPQVPLAVTFGLVAIALLGATRADR
ncbi:MAG TPA: cupredoxin family copper-binding protein [Acidimicrobiales bacterium]|nr:cupredoxin family copper-binding protein [Acidimicrobiales bacterium]